MDHSTLDLFHVDGFAPGGHMAPVDGGCRRVFNVKQARVADVYAWVEAGEVVYVGKATTDVQL